MKAIAILAFILSIVSQPLFAAAVADAEKDYAGTVEKHSWNKSRESYYAGGSEYYLLRADEKTMYILASFRDTIDPKTIEKHHAALSKLEGRKIKIRGAMVTHTGKIPCPENTQCLSMSDQDTFSWIRIKEIEGAANQTPQQVRGDK